MLVSSGGCRVTRRPAAAAPHDMGRAAAGFKPAHADVKIRARPPRPPSGVIGEGVRAIEMGATVENLAPTAHAHPTLSETFGEAAALLAPNNGLLRSLAGHRRQAASFRHGAPAAAFSASVKNASAWTSSGATPRDASSAAATSTIAGGPAT